MQIIYEGSFLPDLSPSSQILIRADYGWLLLGTLAFSLPSWRRYFLSERWGGYVQSSPLNDAIGNPVGAALIACIWFSCAVLIVLGMWTPLASLINLIICYQFFIRQRWSSLLRGMGAPGFLSFWLAAAVFLLEYSRAFAPGMRSLALLVLQVDFAAIMLTAGVSKVASGYVQNNGMELGLTNPMWCYWWKAYSRLSPRNWLLKTFNQLAWSVEIFAAVLMVIPATRLIGSLLILLSFIYILANIRLGFLCEMVILACLLFVHPGSLPDAAISFVVPAKISEPASAAGWIAPMNAALTWGLWIYLAVRPLTVLGLWYNYFFSKRLWAPLQWTLEAFTNAFGIILWRVFTADVVNFHVEIEWSEEEGAKRHRLARYDTPLNWRFNQVAESIAVATIFTALKYFPGQPEIFRERLLRYARTLRVPPGCSTAFRVVQLEKSGDTFRHVPISEFVVDAQRESVQSRSLVGGPLMPMSGGAFSVRPGSRPGSYAAT